MTLNSQELRFSSSQTLMESSSNQNSEIDQEHAQGGISAAANKRKGKKNLREKRRSTGVIIMPQSEQANVATIDTDVVKANTLLNEEDTSNMNSVASNNYSEMDSVESSELISQLEEYRQAIEEWQSAYESISQELQEYKTSNENLTQEYQRLKGEYDALMKVVKMINK